MKKFLTFLMLGSILNLGFASHFTHIVGILSKTYGVDVDMKNIEHELQKLDEKELDAIIGHYGYGDLLNSDADFSDLEWAPKTWEDALKSIDNNSVYSQLDDKYKESHPTLTQDEIKKGTSDEYADYYQQIVQTNKAATVQATYTYNDINKHLEKIKKLSDKIEQAKNEKAIADLNVRMNAEIAYLSVEQIKAITLLNQQVANIEAGNIVDRTLASKFNEIPEG